MKDVKCYNVAIMVLMQYIWEYSQKFNAHKITAFEFNQLPFDEKKEYLKTAFEKEICKIYEETKNFLTNYEFFKDLHDESEESPEYKQITMRYRMMYEITEAVKLAVDKVNGVPGGKTVRFKCFLHDDGTPSMNYMPGTHGFYCFGCGKQGEVVDLFNLINLMNIWTGNGSLKFIQQMEIAVKMFVNEEDSEVKNISANGNQSTYHTDFVPYTSEMHKVRHSTYPGFIHIEKDPNAIEYLKRRGITLPTAKRLSVMTYYPSNRDTGKSYGRGYLVFINANGSYVRRLFIKDETLSAACPWPANKWWNKKGAEMGIFNGQVISHCKQFEQVCFVCESAIDAMTIEEIGYHAIGLNGVENAENFVRQINKENLVKYICLADSDTGGYRMIKAFQDKGDLFIPDFLLKSDNDHILCQHKDVNAAFIADPKATIQALDEIVEQTDKFYGF